MTPRKPSAPPDLATVGRKLWRDVVAIYDLRADELPLLAEMARTVDDLATMRAAVLEAGPVVTGSKGQPRPNPLLTEIRGSRLVLARLAGQLGLPDQPGEPGTTSQTPAVRRASKAARARWGEHDGAA